jgi:hypothetical protein
VTYVTFVDEGHGFVRPQNPLAFAAVAEAFFAKHLGGRVQPGGDDFAGSSIRIATGREARAGVAGVMGISVAPHPNPLPARGERKSVIVPRPVYGKRVTIAQRWTNEGQQPARTGRPEHL